MASLRAHAVILYRAVGHADGRVTIVPDHDEGMLGSAADWFSDWMNPDHMQGHILSLYAGGHAQRRIDPAYGDEGCSRDDENARKVLYAWSLETREQELREESRVLVEKHWPEIVAVAAELLRVQTLDDTEVELIADAVGGRDGVTLDDLAEYRERRRQVTGQ